MSTTDQLKRVGSALFGETWKGPLARDLRIPLRMFRRMATGEEKIPPGVWRDLKALLLTHSIACRQIAGELPK